MAPPRPAYTHVVNGWEVHSREGVADNGYGGHSSKRVAIELNESQTMLELVRSITRVKLRHTVNIQGVFQMNCNIYGLGTG